MLWCFSSSNLISPVTPFSFSQAGRLNTPNTTSYSNTIRSSANYATSHDNRANWDVKKAVISSHKVQYKNRKDTTLGTDTDSSDSCPSSPIKIGRKENEETTSVLSQSGLLMMTKSRKDKTKRKLNCSSNEFQACNSPQRPNSLPADKSQSDESHLNKSTDLVKPYLELETCQISGKAKSGSIDCEKVVKASYTSSTLEYLQHFVDEGALNSIPPSLGSEKSLQDAGRKLSIKT